MVVVSEEEAARLRRRGPGARPDRRLAAFDGASEGDAAEETADFAGHDVLFTFFRELAGPVKKLAYTAWSARRKLARDFKAYAVFLVATVWSMPGRMGKVVNSPHLREAVQKEEDPVALAAVVCGGSGVVIFGSGGAVVGAVVGGVCGLVCGALPAIFTFGLSLPIGAVLGGGCGLAAGATVGSGAGAAAGSATGMTAAYFRDEIKYTALVVASRIYDAYDMVVVRPVAAIRHTGRKVGETVHSGADYTWAKANAVGNAVADASADPGVRVTAASAAAGAAALGTAGAAGGALAGGAAGILVGLIPAVFTFGASIPIGAMVGGGAGLCVGGAAGTSVGFCGGGVAGALGYSCRGVPAVAYRTAAGAILRAAEKVNLRAVDPDIAPTVS